MMNQATGRMAIHRTAAGINLDKRAHRLTSASDWTATVGRRPWSARSQLLANDHSVIVFGLSPRSVNGGLVTPSPTVSRGRYGDNPEGE